MGLHHEANRLHSRAHHSQAHTTEQLIARNLIVDAVCLTIFRASECFASRLLGQHRSMQLHGGNVADIDEVKLRPRLRMIAVERIPWGTRMVHRVHMRQCWPLNHKLILSLWREESLQRPSHRKQKRARPANCSEQRQQVEQQHQVWAKYFHSDATADRRRLKFLKLIDDHSRFCLAIRLGLRCKAKDVLVVLEELTSFYPVLVFVCSEDSPEFFANALRRWCKNRGTTTAYIEPCSPWQKVFAECFNSGFRDKFFNSESFATVAEAQCLANRCHWGYTISGHIRPSTGVRPWRQLKQLLHNHPLSLRVDQ